MNFRTILILSLFVIASVLHAATLRKDNFDSSNPWTGMSGYFTTGGGSLTVSPAHGANGTIDAYGTSTASGGLQLSVNSSAASGNWTAGLNSGVLDLLTTNTRGKEFLTLSFSMSSSSTHPVRVRIESYNSGSSRTGGLATLIFPAAPEFYQRFAIDLDTMTPDGLGLFNPSDPKIRIFFELDSAANGTGWPAAAGHVLKIDNLNYSTPKYYVKPASLGGNNNANGLTEATAFATIQRATDLLGTSTTDNIISIMEGAVYSGTNTNGNTVTLSKPGFPDAWIVYKNHPGHKPVVSMVGWQAFQLANNATTSAAYVEIRGLTIRGQSFVDTNGDRRINPAYEGNVGLVNGSSNGNGIAIEGRNNTALRPRHFRFADNIIEYCPGGGIAGLYADRIAVENNIVRNNCWWMIYAGSGISFLEAHDTEAGSNYRMLISGNEVYGNECMLPWYGNGTNFSDGNGIIIDSYNGGYTGRTFVGNNLTYNNGGSGIHVLKASNTDVVHNTAFSNSASPNLNYGQIFTQSTGTDAARRVLNVRVTNNIMFARRNPTGVNSFLYNQSATSVASFDPSTIVHRRNVYAGGDVNPPLGGANLSDNTDLGRNYNASGLFISPSSDPAVADFRLRSAATPRNYGFAANYRSVLDRAGTPRGLTGITDSGCYQTVPGLAWSPVASPVSGRYTSPQNVSLTSDTSGATIVFTTDGSEPAVNGSGVPVNGTLYTGPIAVSSTTTIKALAWKSGLTVSPPTTAIYDFEDLSAVPVTLSLDKTTAIYPGTRVVQALTRTPGAWVRFTTNGTNPTPTTGTPQEYRGYSVIDYAAVRYRAFKSGRADSAVISANITVRASMGNTDDGTTLTPLGANKIRYVRFQTSETFSAAYVFARLNGNAGGYRAAIYSDNAGSPNTRLAVSSLVSNPVAGWRSLPLATRTTLTKNSYYWLAIWSDNASAGIYANATGGTVREATNTSPWPASAGTSSAVAGTENYSIYATNSPPNLAPVVGAGPDQNLGTGSMANLSGSVSDDGVPLAPGTLSQTWSKISGPGTVTFGNTSSVVTSAAFSAAGTYVLRLTATDALVSAFDEITILAGDGITGPPPPTVLPLENVLYRESFGTTASAAINAATIGWQQYTSTADLPNVASTAGSGLYGGISSLTGRPVDLDNVNAGASASLTNGFVFNQNVNRILVFTTEFPIDRTLKTPDVFAWYSQISSTSNTPNSQNLAVRIAGQWYVTTPANNLTTVGSAATFAGPSGGASVYGFSFAASEWRTLAADLGSPFAVGGSPVALPGGNIEAFGVYFTTAGTVTTRFDSFTITEIPPVVPEPTQIQLVSSANPAEPAESVTFTATVSSSEGIPAGTVTFFDEADVLGTALLDDAGVASFGTAVLGAGSHSITATYSATPDHAASTSPPLVQIVRSATAIELSSSAGPVVAGSPVVLTATVTSDSGTPAGNVIFLDGAEVIGTVALDGGGAAALTTSFLTGGVHPITATYSGTTTYAASVSPILDLTILTPYDAWLELHFTEEEREDPEVSGPNADPDADGYDNLLEYACDTDPGEFTSIGLPVVTRNEEGRLTLSFLRARSDISYFVEGADELDDWAVIQTNPGAVGEIVPVTDTAPVDTPRRLLRLKVTIP